MVKHLKEYLRKNEERTLAAKASTPMTSGYRPEFDVSVEVNLADGNHYQLLIRVLRWAVELGRIDITTEVSLLSSHRDGASFPYRLLLPCHPTQYHL